MGSCSSSGAETTPQAVPRNQYSDQLSGSALPHVAARPDAGVHAHAIAREEPAQPLLEGSAAPSICGALLPIGSYRIGAIKC
jgi:hypothetical protein